MSSSSGLASRSAMSRTIARASLSGREAPKADAAHRAIDAIEAELDPPRALGLPLQQHDEIVGELAQLNLDRLDRLYGRGELPLGAEIRRPEARRDRRALEAFERVEPRHRNSAEPRRDRRSGPQRNVADASQARSRHVGDGFLVEAKRSERQIMKELGEGLVAQWARARFSRAKTAPAPKPRADCWRRRWRR